ncbi:nucleobase-ascorbate transporter 10-like [Dorcoceras hygrometricum]|uniref:Nucleobase-ascorbate transporter 10-like n=1 Tax=Dorcoceras hygrometricum TaxID=472368 RepID=A0A2Z7CAF7_9LAMI|nr:nucleobase-ascorbate transporter 10-like [Dorcoceras hygrometricum]
MSNNTSGNPNNTEPQSQPPQPNPVLEQLTGVQYCVNSSPPLLEAILLGFQHYALALGSIVLIPSLLVPEMGGTDGDKAKVIQTLLFVSGINTLLHSFFGTRLASVIGGSYAFLIPMTSIIQSRQYRMIHHMPRERFVHTMREIQGALIISSSVQIIIGFSGLWRVIVRLFTPLSLVPLVSFSGLGLYYLGCPLIAKCVAVGLPELVFIVFISQYLPRFVKTNRPIWDRFALLFSIAIVWVYAEFLTWSGAFKKFKYISCRADSSRLIGAASWIYVPYPFQWGPPIFTPGQTFVAIFSSFVASMESTGSFVAAARYGSATPAPPSVISRGVGWLGIGTLLNALFGSVTGSMALVENAGLLALTKTGSRRVVQISALFMISFSVLGKVGAVFASIPSPIMAASYCIFFGYVTSAGFSFLQFCNLNSFRTKFVLGFSFFVGLSLPQCFKENRLNSSTIQIHTNTEWFHDIISVVFMSHATVAAVIALILDRTLTHQSNEVGKDNGSHWWERFMVYNKDVRSDEFYKLPGNLNKCFPSF